MFIRRCISIVSGKLYWKCDLKISTLFSLPRIPLFSLSLSLSVSLSLSLPLSLPLSLSLSLSFSFFSEVNLIPPLVIAFNNYIDPLGFLPWEIKVAFPRESQLRQSRPTQPTVLAGCFSVSIIHRTLTWTTWSLMCTQMLIHVIAHGGVHTP